jgi:hypothetical protein
MRDADRYRLMGTYRTPGVRLKAVLSCEHKDRDVVVVGFTTGPIPWPIGGPKTGRGRRTPVLFGELIRAVRQESNQAVAYHFGIHPRTVSRFRKSLGIGPMNAGTTRLRKEHGKSEWFAAARAMA